MTELDQLSSRSRPRHVPLLAYILVAIAVLLLLAGFAVVSNAIEQTAFFAASAVVAILARIAQAGSQHEHLIDELRRRQTY